MQHSVCGDRLKTERPVTSLSSFSGFASSLAFYLICFLQKKEKKAGTILPANRFTPQGSWVAHSRLGSQNLLRLLLLYFRISRKGILVLLQSRLYTPFMILSSFRTKLQSRLCHDHKLDTFQELHCPRICDHNFCTST
jgi:hypothetical protein